MAEGLLTPEEAGQLLNIHPETVRLWARQGRIPALKVGNRWRFDREAILRTLKGNAAESQARMGL